ncbi:arabinogalactan endo-1,4-beta-galactosidase [Flaviaesturariibacter flavus]|uniref:Arabinogalactan endo-beta-1,4-galactanase n=1 Tax=Flaviaesturariibacter flavus TaxID=2502780 RepID=A0A4R1BKE2_9BACT|nr:glycosyl hydrolase 53 family protein [Flaviaesturariibacter flavus]TCJ17786.1 arabinogalactan endo-1,4-beta-galactosidase [Flaviaesturariibacter flavus]
MKRLAWFVFALLAACSKSGNSGNTSVAPAPPVVPAPVNDTPFARGADVSWISEMLAAGRQFRDSAGAAREGMELLKSLGMNAIRLRVWVNPAGGWNGKNDVLAKAQRAKNLGLRIMIDFHYSDSWADPGQQTVPAAWASLDQGGLRSAVTSHTVEILDALKTAGITPEWVQVGNETNNGMLWPTGRASTNIAGFAQLVNAGYDAVKSVFPNTKVIVHLSNGWDNSLFRWLFDGLRSNGARWDVIGLSLYPTTSNWASINQQALANMNDLITRYNTQVMVVEVGMPWDSPSESRAFLSDIILKTRSIPDKKGLGVLYWEPQAYGGWNGYTLGAFDNSGRPTAALQAFNN